jgi:uncharacterized protein (DUF1015 family)
MSGVDFRPFRAWRYATNRVELGQVIAPPYDVISPGEQSALYERSPYNVIRLILGKEPDFHEEAARRWKAWTGEGILTQEARPAFYLYEQTFMHPVVPRSMRRLALVGTLKLETPGAVLAHETTFAGPKQDRLLLFERTQTNLSPIFGLYPNSKGLLLPLCRAQSEKPVLFEARDSAGVLHRGWAIEQEEDQKKIREALKDEKILIADGHHRYETALEYQKERRQKSPEAASEAPFDFALTALVALEDEGLLVLPTHRIVRTLGTLFKEELLSRLRPYFDLIPVPERELFSRLSAESPKEKVFGGFFGASGNFLLRLKDLGAIRKFLPKEKPPIWYETEANLLTSLIIRTLWNPPAEKYAEWIGYTHSWEEAARAVREGGAEASFLMRSPKVEAIRELAQAGERMPQKTTYFYPKLADGLFFYHLG